jgi:hypothetical protein
MRGHRTQVRRPAAPVVQLPTAPGQPHRAGVVICMSKLRLASILMVATSSWTGLGI